MRHLALVPGQGKCSGTVPCFLLPQQSGQGDQDRAKDGNPEAGEGAEQEGRDRRGTEREGICRTKSKEGVQEWRSREGGRGEGGTDGCGVTHLSHFRWAGLRRSWGLAWRVGSSQ